MWDLKYRHRVTSPARPRIKSCLLQHMHFELQALWVGTVSSLAWRCTDLTFLAARAPCSRHCCNNPLIHTGWTTFSIHRQSCTASFDTLRSKTTPSRHEDVQKSTGLHPPDRILDQSALGRELQFHNMYFWKCEQKVVSSYIINANYSSTSSDLHL